MTRAVRIAALVLGALALGTGTAAAYPQFQLMRDQTCSGCHLSPAGGTLLSENGLAAAESISQFGTAPEFFYGKVPAPSWLVLGGDVRGSAGYVKTPEGRLTAFPMQLEAYASATFADHFSVQASFGTRPRTYGGSAVTSIWSREHWLMWKQNPGEAHGLFVRAGRFMPVFGLRFAEHPMYVRRFGGTALYTDTYGVSVSYVDPKYEVHATGFAKDPLIDPVAHASGGAAYAEYRIAEKYAVGAEGMAEITADDRRLRAGVIGKAYLESIGVLVQGEVQFVAQSIDRTPTNPDGGGPKQLVGNVVATRFLTDYLMLDVGLGYFNSNLRVSELDRECLDLNLHWFTTSHVELILNARVEMLSFGAGGDTGAYALLQAHYRL